MKTSATYPPKASQALGFLKSGRNDIEIFVEDTAAPNMWVKILKGYLPDDVRLDSVNSLGSRENVIRACRADQALDARKKLYIVDADLDLLTGVPKPRLRHCYRLRGYCVENYFIDEAAFVSAITTTNTKVSESRVSEEFNFSAWVDLNGPILARLFVCYAVTKQLASEEKTVGYSVHRLFDIEKSNYDLCASKVFARIVGLYRIVRRHASKEEVRLVFRNVEQNAKRIGVMRFASGKDYMFPAFYGICRTKFGVNISVDRFKVLVARSMDKRMDAYLLRRLRAVCQ